MKAVFVQWQCRSQCDASHKKIAECDKEIHQIRKENETKKKEIEVLTTLALKTDSTAQDYLRKLRNITQTLAASQARLQMCCSVAYGLSVFLCS